MVHGLSVSDTHNSPTLGTGVGDQVSSLAASVGAGGLGSSVGLHHVVPTATGDVSLHLGVDIFSSAPGDLHWLATQRTLWYHGLQREKLLHVTQLTAVKY